MCVAGYARRWDGGGIHSNSHAHKYIVYVNVKIYWQSTSNMNNWSGKVSLPKNLCGGGCTVLFFFSRYTIKFTLSSLPTKLWCSFMTSRACVDHYLKPILRLYGDVDVCLSACLTLCLCALKWFYGVGMPANEIETETIWMNKLHYGEDKWKIF